MGEDHGGEGVPKAGADLVQWMAAEVFVDAVLEDPYDECHDEEEAACEGPQAPFQWLYEYPCVGVLHALYWYHQ